MKYQTTFGLQYINYLEQKEVYCPGTRKSWDVSLLSNIIANNILFFCTERPHSLPQIKTKLYRDYPNRKDEINKVVESLLKNGLLRKNSDIPLEKLSLCYHKTWKKYNWLEPLIFHWHTNLYPKHDYIKDKENNIDQLLMNTYHKEEERPDVYKQYVNKLSIPLLNKKPENLISNTKIFLSNHSNPIEYKTEEWSFEDFAAFCYLSFGETGRKNARHYDFVDGEYKPIYKENSTRCYPSGGARHPTEVYIVINNINSIDKGLYHYNVLNHSIELLESGDFSLWLQKFILYPKKRISFVPSMVCIYSSLFERSMFRYREPRSYRVMHYDLGHLMKNVNLISRAYSRDCYSGPSLPEKLIEELINLDGIRESVMSFSAVS